MRILTTIACYSGNENIYLKQVVEELKQVSDVVLFSPEIINIDGVKTEIRSKDLGHSLVFEPRQYIIDHINEYDYFLYNEDDIFISKEALQFAIETNQKLIKKDIQYNVGFLRYELEGDKEEFVDLSPYNSVNLGGNGVTDIIKFVTKFDDDYYFHAWNPHSGNFLFSRDQIELLIYNNKFPTKPEKSFTGILESGATGFVDSIMKFSPIKDYRKLMVHHMSNKYIFNPVKIDCNLLDNFFRFLPEDLASQYLNLK
jgi:hypothetical protein